MTVKFLFQDREAENNSNKNVEEYFALEDKLQEYKCLPSKQHLKTEKTFHQTNV